jgi:hypothetical protein
MCVATTASPDLARRAVNARLTGAGMKAAAGRARRVFGFLALTRDAGQLHRPRDRSGGRLRPRRVAIDNARLLGSRKGTRELTAPGRRQPPPPPTGTVAGRCPEQMQVVAEYDGAANQYPGG